MLKKEERDRIRLRVRPYGKPTGMYDTRRLLDDIDELRRLLWVVTDKWEYDQRDPKLLNTITELLND